jgi:hypothetical protein
MTPQQENTLAVQEWKLKVPICLLVVVNAQRRQNALILSLGYSIFLPQSIQRGVGARRYRGIENKKKIEEYPGS